MTFENQSPWQPDPKRPNALERLMRKGSKDPSLHGEMFRVMLETELFLLVPATGLSEGPHLIEDDFQWRVFQDQDGDFVPVFTSEAVAMKILEGFPDITDCAIAGMEARVLFQLLRNTDNTLRIYADPRILVVLDPAGVNHLLEGNLTESRPSSENPQRLTLHPVTPDGMPPRLLAGLRDFCSKRRVPLGVYAFHVEDPGTGEQDMENIHLILWLRGTDNHFYNDFVLMAQKLAPEGIDILVGVVTSEQTEQVEFLSSRPPVWPDLELSNS